MNVIFDHKKRANDYDSFNDEALKALFEVMTNTLLVFTILHGTEGAVKADTRIVFEIARELEYRRLENLTDTDIIEWQRTHSFCLMRPSSYNGGQYSLKYCQGDNWTEEQEVNSCDYREVFFKAIRKGDYK